jgi:hypothetical protein
MTREKLLDHMADMAALLVGDCLEYVEMDGIRYEDLRDFKGYCFHSFTSCWEYPVPGYLMPVCRERATIYV